jgi:ribose 5-phosphate isomerase B
MPDETIAIAADHAGFELKNLLKDELIAMGYAVLDLGTNSAASVDYPDFGLAAAQAVAAGKAQKAVVVCGSGIGISIAANRLREVRAALCHDALTARLGRQHNDANVLALGARTTSVETARDCLRVFLSTPFEGGRHASRVAKLGRTP